jgi:hypothetical protein
VRRKLAAFAAVAVVYGGLALAAVAGTASSAQTGFVAGAPTTRVGVDVIIVVTTIGGVSCPGAPNEPDGEDPWGGCFPGESTTGVPDGVSLTAYSGSTNPAADTVIDSKLITSCMTITQPRVVIRRSRIQADCSWVIDSVFTAGTSADWVLVEDSEIVCVSESQGGIGEHNFHINRVEISGGCANNVDGDEDFLVEESYLHGLPVEDETHHGDGIQSCCVDNAIIRHNSIIGQDDFGGNTTSAIIMPQIAVTGTALIEHNFLAGGAFTLYCAPNGTDFRANNNVIGQRPGPWGAAFGYTQNCDLAEEFSGNVSSNGDPITP